MRHGDQINVRMNITFGDIYHFIVIMEFFHIHHAYNYYFIVICYEEVYQAEYAYYSYKDTEEGNEEVDETMI